MKQQKSILFFIAALIILIPLVYFLYPNVHPYTALKNISDKQSVENTAENILSELGVSTEDFTKSTTFETDKRLLRQSQMENGISESNRDIADGLPAYRWKMRWRKSENDSSADGLGMRRRLANLIGTIRMEFDPAGKLLRYEIESDEKMKLPVITEKQAEEIAAVFLNKYCIYKDLKPDTSDENSVPDFEELVVSLSSGKTEVETENTEALPVNKTDYKFEYTAFDSHTGNDVDVDITVKGSLISAYRVSQDIPDEYKEGSLASKLIVVIIGALLMILMVVLAFKKFRAYEIGFKTALFMGVLSALSLFIMIVVETSANFEWEVVIGWVLGPLFSGLGLTIVWAVSEASSREIWKRKYTEFDLLVNGYYLNSNIGKSVLYGLGIGMLLISVWTIATYAADSLFRISVMVYSDEGDIFIGSGGAFYLLTQNFYKTVFNAAFIVGFIVTLLKSRFNSNIAVIIAGALAWTLLVQGDIEPFWVTLVIEFLLALLIVYTFIRSNLMTVFVALLTFSILFTGLTYFFIPSSDMEGASTYLLIMFFIPVVYGLVSIFTKDKIHDLDSITPAFAKNITERQRLQGELEAAKSIQESFLPAETPDIPGLQIAAKCLPALEVGGDYYDFVKHDSNKLSIIIGDVAGKGAKAAFVMSLTKGFFKALARTMANPSKVLSEINEMFYENVGRGSFISAIFGIFDLTEKKFTYARAGHNPLIFVRQAFTEAKFLQPDGIALGMEKGILFSKTIKEDSLELQSGDLFVLYTDGFTEAMNKKDEQYGEEALKRIVELNKEKSPQELMEIIFTETLKFIGRAKQYDDMTIMIIKVE